MHRAILIFSFLGIALFGAAFVLSFVEPLLVERAAREFIRVEVERDVGEKVATLTNSHTLAIAQKALGRTDAEIDATRRQMAETLPLAVATVLADMQDADCECRKRLAQIVARGQVERLASLGNVRDRLVGLIESAYASVTAKLLREFRIFTASNGAAFVLLALITWLRRGAALQLVLPAIVLASAVLTTGGVYLFDQDWLHTILYDDYIGFAYAGYLGAVALFFADIAFNRARVTTRLVNWTLQLVGSAVQAVPC